MTGSDGTVISKWNRVLLENIILHIPHFIFWKDINFKYQGCNQNYARLLSLNSLVDIIGKTDYELGWRSDGHTAEFFQQRDQEVLNGNVIENLEQSLSSPNGEKIVVLLNKTPLYDENHKIFGILGVSTNVTELKASEARERAAILAAEHYETISKIETERRKAVEQLVATVAHELRTPLQTINLGISAIKKFLTPLIDVFNLAKKSNLTVPELNKNRLETLPQFAENIEKEIQYTFTFINMLLANVNEPDIFKAPQNICSIDTCVSEAIKRYPFNRQESELIEAKITDFNFNGNQDLIIHLLFNLFKNSLYYIKGKKEAKITLWCDCSNTLNTLHFRDNGAGIAPDILPRIFERFFSRTYHGTGVGLSFSKAVMESVGGDITCHSTLGEYTEFVLSFPTISTAIIP